MNKQYIDELCGLFMRIEKKNEILPLLQDLLTPHEFACVVERLQIFKMLAAGVPHRTISQKLKVSISKVTRGSHAFQSSKSIVNHLT